MNLTKGITKYLLRKGLWEGSWEGFQLGWFLELRQWIDGVCPPKPCPFYTKWGPDSLGGLGMNNNSHSLPLSPSPLHLSIPCTFAAFNFRLLFDLSLTHDIARPYNPLLSILTICYFVPFRFSWCGTFALIVHVCIDCSCSEHVSQAQHTFKIRTKNLMYSKKSKISAGVSKQVEQSMR